MAKAIAVYKGEVTVSISKPCQVAIREDGVVFRRTQYQRGWQFYWNAWEQTDERVAPGVVPSAGYTDLIEDEITVRLPNTLIKEDEIA